MFDDSYMTLQFATSICDRFKLLLGYVNITDIRCRAGYIMLVFWVTVYTYHSPPQRVRVTGEMSVAVVAVGLVVFFRQIHEI